MINREKMKFRFRFNENQSKTWIRYTQFYKKVKKLDETPWNEKLADELHKLVRRNFQKRRVEVEQIDDIWGGDLVEMQEWNKQNNGFRYMLNVINVFSKFAWSISYL